MGRRREMPRKHPGRGYIQHSDPPASSRRESRGTRLYCSWVHGQIVEHELNVTPWGRLLKLFRRISALAQWIPVFRKVWRLLVMKSLIQLPAPDWPPVIKYRKDKWTVRRER